MAKCEGCNKNHGQKAVTDIKRSRALSRKATKEARRNAAKGVLAKPAKKTAKKAAKKPGGGKGGGKPCNCGKLVKATIKVPKVHVPKIKPVKPKMKL